MRGCFAVITESVYRHSLWTKDSAPIQRVSLSRQHLLQNLTWSYSTLVSCVSREASTVVGGSKTKTFVVIIVMFPREI